MLAFNVAGIAVSGMDVQVCDVQLRGLRDPRLIVKNAGAVDLSGARVIVKPTQGGAPAIVDDATFSTLAAGQTLERVVPGPVEWLELERGLPDRDVARCGHRRRYRVVRTNNAGFMKRGHRAGL